MSYPSVVTSFSTKVNGAVIDASDVNNVQTDVVAIETFVGTEASTVGTLFYDIRAAGSNGGGHIQSANKGGTGQTAYTKGDLLVASSSSVLSKLAVGSDNQVLTADSTQTAGAKWATAAAGEWTQVSIMTFTNSATPQSFAGLASHNLYKVISNIRNLVNNQITYQIQVNSVAGTAYNYNYSTNLAVAETTGTNAWTLMRSQASQDDSYFGEAVINGNTPSQQSSTYGIYHSGSSIHDNAQILLQGNVAAVSSVISKINIVPNAAISGTVELRYKDIA